MAQKRQSSPRFRRSSSKKLKTQTDLFNKPNSPKQLKFKAKSQMLFGDFATQIQTKSLDTIMNQYQTNPFFKTKINLILAQFQKNLEENHMDYQQFMEHALVETKSQTGSFNQGTPIKYQTLKNKIGKNNYAYALRLMEIKEHIKNMNN